jgi:hypothetical protein
MTDVIADSTDITTAAGTIQASAKGTYGSLSNVLAVDDITANLLSISEATRPGYVAVFTRDEFKLMKSDDVYITGTPLISGKQANGVYEADIPATPLPHMESALVADARIDNEFELWHRRFGHCSVRTLKDTMRSVTGMSFPKTHIKHFHAKGICHGCAVGKLDKKPVRRHELKKQLPVQMKPGGLFVMDLLTSPTKSFGGNYYALIIVDAATRYAWAYFLPNKSDATVGVQQWLKTLKQYGIRTETFTTVRTDNGGEFLNSEFLETLQEAGIKRELSPPYGHVYMAERAIRTLQSNARAMMATEGLSAGFWAEALAYAVYTYNRLVSKSCKSKTKYELFFGVKPDVSNLRTFGCVVYARVYDEVRKKWDPKAFRGRFVGFDEASPKTWKVFNLSNSSFTNTSHVVFDETIRSLEGSSTGTILDTLFVDSFPADAHVPSSEVPGADSDGDDDTVVDELHDDLSQDVLHLIRHPVASRTRSHQPRGEQALIAEFASLRAADLKTPATFKQSEKSEQADQWAEARDAENASWVKNNVLQIEKRQPRTRSLGFKWVFKIKEAIDGSVSRFKARICALGNLQRVGFDYDETFAPVVRYSTLRILLALSAVRGYVVHQMDVDTAFLYGLMPADTPIYLDLPQGYLDHYELPEHLKNEPVTNLVGKLNKSVYGLKQAPRLWNENINAFMTANGFSRSLIDSCLYHRHRGGEVLYVALFVDDLVIAGSSMHAVDEFKSELRTKYNMKDLGQLKYCLGIEVETDVDKGTITLRQSKYINDIIKRFGLCEAHPEPIPMTPNLKLSKSMAPQTPEAIKKAHVFPYREMVGSLMYLMVSTRPDISYAVGQLAMYMNCHGPEHHAAVLHLLRYVKGTSDLGITYGNNEDAVLHGYSDSDWAANIDTRRSTTGYVFFLCGGPVSWRSKVQQTVALSSTEAEYMALTSSAQEAMSLRMLCKDFHVDVDDAVLLYEDNQGAIAMSINPVMHSTAKHISIKQHFIREKVQNGDVRLEYISTVDMIADALTKALSKVTFLNLRCKLMGQK